MDYFKEAKIGEKFKEIKNGSIYRSGLLSGIGTEFEKTTGLIVDFGKEYKVFLIADEEKVQTLFYEDDPNWEYFHAATEDMLVDEFDREGKYKRTGKIYRIGGLIEVEFSDADETSRWTKSGYKNFHEPQTLFYHEPRSAETINVDLEKVDLIRLISGIGVPNVKFHKELEDLKFGSYSHLLGRWNWADAGLNKLTVPALWNIYVKIKPLNK